MDRLTGMIEFVRTVETGSFVAAARTLGASKSGVSVAVARLEARLGVRLLRRTTRLMSLTDEGASFFDDCRRILAELERAKTSVRSAAADLSGTLRVDMPPSVAHHLVVPWLAEFRKEHPRLSVDLRANDRVVDLAAEGVDCVLRIGAPQDSSLISRKVADSRYVTVAAPAYLKRHGAPVSPDDLVEHDTVGLVYPNSRLQLWAFRHDGARGERTMESGLRMNSVGCLLDVVRGGGGVAQLLDFIVADDVRAGRLVPVLKNYEADGKPLHLLTLPDMQKAPKVRASASTSCAMSG